MYLDIWHMHTHHPISRAAHGIRYQGSLLVPRLPSSVAASYNPLCVSPSSSEFDLRNLTSATLSARLPHDYAPLTSFRRLVSSNKNEPFFGASALAVHGQCRRLERHGRRFRFGSFRPEVSKMGLSERNFRKGAMRLGVTRCNAHRGRRRSPSSLRGN